MLSQQFSSVRCVHCGEVGQLYRWDRLRFVACEACMLEEEGPVKCGVKINDVEDGSPPWSAIVDLPPHREELGGLTADEAAEFCVWYQLVLDSLRYS